jgi:hypothetical protein
LKSSKGPWSCSRSERFGKVSNDANRQDVALRVCGCLYLAFLQNKPIFNALISIEISALLNKANEFDGRRVTITGIVSQSAALFGYGTYRLRQGDSEVWVLTGHGVPSVVEMIRTATAFGLSQRRP